MENQQIIERERYSPISAVVSLVLGLCVLMDSVRAPKFDCGPQTIGKKDEIYSGFARSTHTRKFQEGCPG